MSNRIKILMTAMILSSGVLCSLPAQESAGATSSAAQRAHDEAQQLLRARDEARQKARVAQKKLLEAGVRLDPLGFDSARATRDQQVTATNQSGDKLASYDRYAKSAKRLERKIQTEIEAGIRPIEAGDIARFERLQAEVELAQAEGRLPIPKHEGAITEAYEQTLSALRSERRKFKAGKCTLFEVCQVAKDLRDADLGMTSTATQQIAALARYEALLHELEELAVSELDRMMARRSLEDAEADLLRAKVDGK